MAITRPVTKTVISTAAFGVPVADALNDFLFPHIAAKASVAVGGTLGSGVWTNIAGASLTFTPRADWLYEVRYGTCVIGTNPGAWWAVSVSGLPGGVNWFTRAQPLSNSANWGHTQDATSFLNGVLLAQPYTVQLQANISGGGSISNAQESYIYIINHGPKV